MGDCDSKKALHVRRHLKIEPHRRDANWKTRFYDLVVDASFAARQPEVFVGPDGFPYFGLHTPPSNGRFEPHCILELIEPLTSQGVGIALNPRARAADWVFTSGDLLLYRLYRTFDPPEERPDPLWLHEEVLVSDQVLASAPSRDYLPEYTRLVLRRFIESRLQIESPGVFLLHHTAEAPAKRLVFSIHREHFEDDRAFDAAMNALAWFLPRHYGVAALSRDHALARHFQSL